MSFAKLRVKLKSVFSRFTSFGFRLKGRHVVVRHLAQQRVSAGKACICERVVWVFFDGLQIGFDTPVEVPAIGPVKPAAKISIVGYGIDGARGPFCTVHAESAYRQRHANLPGNCGGNFVLNVEDVTEVAGVRIGPQMCLITDLNELHIDPDLIAAATHATFEGILHIQRTTYLRDGFTGEKP